MELNVNNWIKVPKLGNGYFQVSEVFEDGVNYPRTKDSLASDFNADRLRIGLTSAPSV